MKAFWIHILLILMVSITIPNFREEIFNGDNHLSTTSLTKDIPILDESIPANTRKEGLKKNYIAQDFLPIVVIAKSTFLETTHLHYLPLYNLRREKVYFLLI